MLRWACQTIITEDDLSCPCHVNGVDLTPDETTELLECACDALARITGLAIGRCTTVYRPCRRDCHPRGCWCGCELIGIRLPGWDPTVTSVTIDGATVSPANYGVVTTASGTKYLERFNEDGHSIGWPTTQRLGYPTTSVGTFAVTVEAGMWPDYVMRNAAAEIACDILAQLSSERDTTDGLVAASGYGVSYDFRRFGDPTDQETMALAGLSWVRRFVAATGGAHVMAIWSPEYDRGWQLFSRE